MIRVTAMETQPYLVETIFSALNDQPDIALINVIDEYTTDIVMPESDVFLANIRLLDDGTPSLLRAVKKRQPDVQIILTGTDESEHEVARHMDVGAYGYVDLQNGPEELCEAVRLVAQGGAALSPTLAAAVMNRLSQLTRIAKVSPFAAPALEQLTPRQVEIVRLLQDGYSNQDIAEELEIELGTVKNHVHNILLKFGVRDRHSLCEALSQAAVISEMPAGLAV
jgi:two-component system NarL family response regulator